jgi:hypothetical protein
MVGSVRAGGIVEPIHLIRPARHRVLIHVNDPDEGVFVAVLRHSIVSAMNHIRVVLARYDREAGRWNRSLPDSDVRAGQCRHLMAREDLERCGALVAMWPINDSRSDDRRGKWLMLAAVGLGLTVVVADAEQLESAVRLKTGDAIVFTPVTQPMTRLQSPITVSRIAAPAAIRCVIDPQVLEQRGGSLMIEATQFKPQLAYRTHWAGTRTSDSGQDCGASADLLLSPAQVTALSMEANRAVLATTGYPMTNPVGPDLTMQ